MTATVDTPSRTAAPWHLWAVGVVSLLWNAFGCFDYFMTQTKGDLYLQGAGMNAAQIAAIHAAPAWATGAWAIGVWGALAGSILLLARSRYALWAFAASLAGALVSFAHAYLRGQAPGAITPNTVVMNIVVVAVCLFLLWYAASMAKRGVLR